MILIKLWDRVKTTAITVKTDTHFNNWENKNNTKKEFSYEF